MSHRAASNSIHVLSRVVCALALALLAPTAAARTVFFDGFDGPNLHPRWTHGNGPNGGDWTYDFDNSMFNLRSVTAPAQGQIWWRRVDMGTPVDLPGDFTVSARVGWTAGGPAREIGIRLLGETFFFAEIKMDEWLTGRPTYDWSVGPGGRGNAPAPMSTMVELTLQRTGSTVRALIDGVQVASSSRAPDRIRGLSITLLGDARDMRPLHLDSVSVVPGTGTAMLFSVSGAFVLLYRRRSYAGNMGRR